MTEDFIITALEAFENSNGDIDKFELYLRRQLMSIQAQTPTAFPPLPSPDNLNITPEMAEELAGLDLDNMTDEDIIDYARKLGMSI